MSYKGKTEGAEVISIVDRREWQAEPIQLHLFDYRIVPTGTFASPKRASDMQPKFRTRKEVAALFGKTIRTTDTWTRKGQLHAVKMGGSVLYENDQLWIDIAKNKIEIVELAESLKKTG